jgi:hypothetical protein
VPTCSVDRTDLLVGKQRGESVIEAHLRQKYKVAELEHCRNVNEPQITNIFNGRDERPMRQHTNFNAGLRAFSVDALGDTRV